MKALLPFLFVLHVTGVMSVSAYSRSLWLITNTLNRRPPIMMGCALKLNTIIAGNMHELFIMDQPLFNASDRGGVNHLNA